MKEKINKYLLRSIENTERALLDSRFSEKQKERLEDIVSVKRIIQANIEFILSTSIEKQKKRRAWLRSLKKGGRNILIHELIIKLYDLLVTVINQEETELIEIAKVSQELIDIIDSRISSYAKDKLDTGSLDAEIKILEKEGGIELLSPESKILLLEIKNTITKIT
ncbi:MAG: hypothetical protein ACJATI_002738, partial [Halioglobus sp.]